MTDKIADAEKFMLDKPQRECSVVHSFGPGVYIREVTIPADTFAIGHHQNFEHMNVMLKGRVSVVQDDGTVKELVAPLIYTGKPGRKVGYIHEDVVWLNIYPTELRDVAELEAKYITKSEAFELSQEKTLLLQNMVDSDDYKKALTEFGVTEKVAQEQSNNTSDLIDFPDGSYKVAVQPSTRHGKGLFSTSKIAAGEVICPARLGGHRTPAGRYTNHAKTPNAEFRSLGAGDIELVALTDISGCHGGRIGDEITVDYRQARALALSL